MSIRLLSRLRAAALVLLAAFGAPAAHAANGTLVFTSDTGFGDGVASDGEGGSLGLAGIEI